MLLSPNGKSIVLAMSDGIKRLDQDTKNRTPKLNEVSGDLQSRISEIKVLERPVAYRSTKHFLILCSYLFCVRMVGIGGLEICARPERRPGLCEKTKGLCEAHERRLGLCEAQEAGQGERPGHGCDKPSGAGGGVCIGCMLRLLYPYFACGRK